MFERVLKTPLDNLIVIILSRKYNLDHWTRFMDIFWKSSKPFYNLPVLKVIRDFVMIN